MERQDLSQLRRIHRRRSRTDAPNLTQPENMGNTLQPTLEQNSPRTTPSVQSRKLDRDPKTGQPNTRLRPEKSTHLKISSIDSCEWSKTGSRGESFLESLYRIATPHRSLEEDE